MLRNLTTALALGLLVAMPVAAAELAGVSMAPTAKVGDQTLQLNGMALRSKMVFKVYVAGLYLPAKQTDATKVLADDTARHLVMHWVRSVDKGAICEAWTEGLEANTPNAGAEVKAQFEKLCSWMEDARAGDQYLFTYVPGTGTTVTVKGKAKGTVAGKAFADALFASWIGPKPGPGEDFKKALMGG